MRIHRYPCTHPSRDASLAPGSGTIVCNNFANEFEKASGENSRKLQKEKGREGRRMRGGWHFSTSQSLCANKQNVCQRTEALSALAGLPVTHFESSSQQEGWVGFSLNKIKWGKENKKRSKRKPCLGGSFDTGKISPWRGLILFFSSPSITESILIPA